MYGWHPLTLFIPAGQIKVSTTKIILPAKAGEENVSFIRIYKCIEVKFIGIDSGRQATRYLISSVFPFTDGDVLFAMAILHLSRKIQIAFSGDGRIELIFDGIDDGIHP